MSLNSIGEMGPIGATTLLFRFAYIYSRPTNTNKHGLTTEAIQSGVDNSLNKINPIRESSGH